MLTVIVSRLNQQIVLDGRRTTSYSIASISDYHGEESQWRLLEDANTVISPP